MNKRRIHHVWTRFRHIKSWYFLVVAIIFGVICAFALRANNQQMIVLREAVYTADKENGDIETALKSLQIYVTSHMNTDLSAGDNAVYPPIQLKYTYDRLVQARSATTGEQNKQVYSDAQKQCEKQNPNDFSGRNRIPCIQQYVQSHTVTGPSEAVPDALYKFSFVSPRWSPDLAGWSLLVTIISFALFLISLSAHLWFKHQLNRK